MTITFINPVAECQAPINPYLLSADLNESITVGLVSNAIVDCDVFMRQIANALVKIRPGISVKHYSTGKITYADETLMDQVAEECDAAVCAIGHCGSCTAGTVKDAIALVERNCPAVSLVTEVFWEQSEILARSLGWSDSPRVMLPYPIWGTDKDTMAKIANSTALKLTEKFETINAQAA